jgi:hypothetical protein
VLVGVRRDAAAEPLQVQVKAHEQHGKELVALSEKSLVKERKPYQALVQLLSAIAARVRAEAALTAFDAVRGAQGSQLPLSPDLAIEALTGRIGELTGALQLRPAAGDGQRLAADGRVPEPLVVAVELVQDNLWAPMDGAPIQFQNASAGAPLLGEARTDAQGRASLAVTLPAGPPGGCLAGLDGARVLQDAGLDPKDSRWAVLRGKITAAQARFEFLAAAKGGLRILLQLYEGRSGGWSASTVIAAVLAAQLEPLGHTLVDPITLAKSVQDPTSADQVLAAARGKADVVILGQIEAKLHKTVAEGFMFSEASGELRALKVENGQELCKIDKTVKAAGSDEWSADDRALGNWARQAWPILLEGLNKAAVSP